MSTRIESAGPRGREQVVTVERVPWAQGEGYLVTTARGKRFLRSWGATLDFLVQALEPRT